MKNLKLELDDNTYQKLKEKFQGDEEAMCNFAAKILANELLNTFSEENKEGSDKNKDLEKYLKSGKTGSRSYGIKGQGW